MLLHTAPCVIKMRGFGCGVIRVEECFYKPGSFVRSQSDDYGGDKVTGFCPYTSAPKAKDTLGFEKYSNEN